MRIVSREDSNSDPGNDSTFFPTCGRRSPWRLTPAGRARFMVYLLETAKQFVPLTDEEILWFHLSNAEDEHQGLVTTYLLMPEWQGVPTA